MSNNPMIDAQLNKHEDDIAKANHESSLADLFNRRIIYDEGN